MNENLQNKGLLVLTPTGLRLIIEEKEQSPLFLEITSSYVRCHVNSSSLTVTKNHWKRFKYEILQYEN